VSRVTSAATARVAELVDRARAESGLDDFGGDSWRAGLEVLVASALDESSFNELGEQLFYGGIVRTLTVRLAIEDWYRRHPEIDEQEVDVELLGVGFPRTGSTALSCLLAEDDSVRSLRMWEAGSPCPPPGLSADADEERIAAAGAALDLQQQALPQMQAMLPSSATGPMEDHELMALEFTSQMQLAFARVPTYAEWFLGCDMEPTYRYEKRVLKLLQWKCPPHRWQLKSPTHTLFLDAFTKVFPECRFVMTHRDVADVLPSVADLYYTLLQTGNTRVDKHEVARLNMQQWGTALERVLAFRSGPNDDRFFDIGFAAFQADPLAEVGRLYEWLGRDLTADTKARIRAWREENPRDKHGAHTYAAADFGITAEMLAARFGAYRQRFAEFLT
jgi:hypothetical protein